MANLKSKSKLEELSGNGKKSKLGTSTSSDSKPSPLMPKKDYKKNKGSEVDFGNTGFGETGMTGRS